MLHLSIKVDEDFVCFIGAPKIGRPMHVSRARWLAFWEFIRWQQITPRSLEAAERVMKGIRDGKAFDY